MAMNAKEQIEFFSEQAKFAANALVVARENNNIHLAVMNAGEIIKCSMMCVLLSWRQGVNPRHLIRETILKYGQTREILADLNLPDEVLAPIGFERVAVLAYLIDEPFDLINRQGLTSDGRLDAIIAQYLNGEEGLSDWAAGISALKAAGSSLALDTYLNYHSIMTADKSQLPGLVEKAYTLFKKRKRDGFYSGGDQTAGGGPDNDFVVDYLLAALCKRRGHHDQGTYKWCW